MAEIVGALGIPHNPFVAMAIHRGDAAVAESKRFYAELERELAAMRADTLIVFTTDHYNLFFELIMPIFAIGVAERSWGPSDYPPLPQIEVALDAQLARELQTSLVHGDFDVCASQEFAIDHTILAPLPIIAPQGPPALVPFWISGSLRPLPSASRCYSLGQALRHAVEASSLQRRVVVAGSGTFSFEVGGPRMSEDSHVGVPAPEWAIRVSELLAGGDFEQVVAETTRERLVSAGNASGEILNWIAMLGALGPAPASFIEIQATEGHAYAAWQVDA